MLRFLKRLFGGRVEEPPAGPPTLFWNRAQEHFAQMVAQVRDYAVFLLDASGNIRTWNAGAEHLKGYRAEDIIGQHFSRFYPKESVSSGWPAHELAVAAATGRFEDEGWRLRKDGTRFWASVIITALRDPSGEVKGFLKITRDLTDRKQTEEKLRLSEERFRLMVESVKDYAIFMLDPEGRVATWNAGAQRIKGYTADEIIGQHFSQFYPGDAVARGWPEEELRRAIADGRFEDEGWRVRKDGTRFWASVVITTLRDQSGALRGFARITRDLTDQKIAEENATRLLREEAARKAAEDAAQAIERQRMQLHVTLQSIGDGVIATDDLGQITLLNPVAEALTGWPTAEASGKLLHQVFSLINETTRNPIENPVERVLREGNAVGLANGALLISKDGREQPIADSAAPIKDDSGKLIGVVLAFRDITEQRARENKRAARLAVTQILAEMNSVREAASAILRTLCESLNWSMGGFWEVDPRSQRLRCVDVWQSASLSETDFLSVSLEIQLESGVDLPGHVWQSAHAAWIPDIIQYADFPRSAVAAQGGLRTGFGFPIAASGEVRAVIELYRRDVRPPDAELIEMASTIGVLIGQFMERKSAEDRLRFEREWFRTTLASIGDAVITTDTEGRVSFLNAVAEGLTGWSPATVALGKPLEDVFKIINEHTRLPVENPVSKTLREGHIVGMANHTLLISRSGAENPIEDSAAPIQNERGETVGVVLVFRDVTERRAAEKMLRDSEQRWRTMAEALPNLVWTGLPNGQFDWISSQWGKYTSVPETELLGMDWLKKVVHVDDQERTLAHWQSACADRSDYDLEYRIRRFDGEYHWFKTRGVPLRDRHGKIAYWFGTSTDIEDVKRLEAELRETDRRKNEFLAILAHELRNPLAPIRNGLRVLRLANDLETREQALEMMERQLGQLVRLIDDLLDISRISRNKLELRRARIRLASVVENAVETARPLIDVKGHVLTVSLPPQPIFLNADLTRLAQVFWNLLNNSAKYTDPKGKIEFSAQMNGSELVVRVRDTGIGIPAPALPTIFNLFSQVDHSLERSQGGLGIGLALVKGLVEMHGGAVEAHSEGVGRGSEFVVRLPVVQEQEREMDTPLTNSPILSASRRVLVVDDNRDSAASLAMMLSLIGHETRTAHDGFQAIELAEVFQPDLILLDIGLPKLNGYEAARRIRDQSWAKNVFIVAVTGWGQEEDKRRAKEAGFDLHMVKPMEPANLEKVLAGLKQRNS